MPRSTKGEVYYRGDRLWIRFQVNGKRYAEPARVDTEPEAHLHLYRRIAEESKGRAVGAMKDAPVGAVADLWAKLDGRSNGDRRTVARFVEWFGPAKAVSAIDGPTMIAYSGQYMQRAKATTVRQNLCTVSAFLRWCRAHGYAVPEFKIPWPRGRSVSPDALGAVEVDAVLESIRGHPIFEPFYRLVFQGLRAGEAIALTWEDIDRSAMTLRIGAGKTDSSSAVVPIFGQLAEWVRSQPADATGFLVPLKIRKYMGVYHRMRLWNRTHEVKLPNPHRCRHTIATSLLKRGVPLLAVSKLLRHASPGITAQIYVHADAVDFRHEFERGSERRDVGKE